MLSEGLLDLKNDILKFGNEAKQLMETNTNLKKQIEIKSNSLKFHKSQVNKYFQTTNPSNFIKDIKNYNEEIRKKNHLISQNKIDIEKKNLLKFNQLKNEIDGLLTKLETERENKFLLENAIAKCDYEIKANCQERKNFKKFELFREDKRYIYDQPQEVIESLLDRELLAYQQRMGKVSHEANTEMTKIDKLNKEASNLKTEIGTIGTSSQNQTKISGLNPKRAMLGLKPSNNLVPRKKSLGLSEKLEDNNFDFKDNLFFPFEDGYIESEFSNENDDIDIEDINPTNQNMKTTESIIQGNVPKLNLRQIEFNKVKITVEKQNAPKEETQTKKKMNSCLLPALPKQTLEWKILQKKNEIKELKGKIKQNKEIISSFRKYYKKIQQMILQSAPDSEIGQSITTCNN